MAVGGSVATTLGRHDEADHHFAHAASTQERVGARGMLIHTQLAWARMLLARNEPGDDGRAATLVAAARSTAHDLGYPELERRAAEISR